MLLFAQQIQKVIDEGLPGTKSQLKMAPEIRGQFPDNKHKIDAAVLILLFKDENKNINTVFIKRQFYSGHHSAQISFPGGKSESTDKSLAHTALRESNEEIGVNPQEIEVIGKLTQLYIPVSNFMVHPYIGISKNKPEFNIDKAEVDYLIIYPINKLVDHTISYTKMEYMGKSYQVPFYDINGEMIWGATSMILSEFLDVIKKLD